MKSTPPGFVEDPPGFVPDEPAPDTRNAVTRAYQSVIKPVTSLAASAINPLVHKVTEPLVTATRMAQERSFRPIIEPGSPAASAQPLSQGIAESVIPQTPLEAGMMAGTMGAGGLAARAGVSPALAALSRVTGGVVGGVAGDVAEGGSGGRGALVGGIGGVGGEAVGKGMEIVRRMLPGAKAAISRDDARRFGQTLEDVAGVPGARSATDFADQATAAAQRRMASETAYGQAQAAHKEAVVEARRRAAQQTREGRADRTAEWQRRQTEHRQQVEAAEEQARLATERATAAQREQQAEGVRGIIERNVPQLGPAFEGQGAAALRGAGAGRARNVLGEGKEAVTRQLEAAAPEGIVVPSLAPPREQAFTIGPLGDIVPVAPAGPQRMAIRDALEELSLLGADATTQFARNPLDRNIRGAARRRRYGELLHEIRRGLDEVEPGLGETFLRGQEQYRTGFAASRALLEPDASYLPTGDVNLPNIASRVVKPRTRRALEDKLGPERYEQITTEITALPRDAPRIEPVLPPPPQRPLQVAPVVPDIPPAPTPPAQSPADVVMSTLFGPQNRILQGRDTLVNWPAIQKALQAPEVRAQLEAVLGPERYQQLLRSALRGATSGADVPVRGEGYFLSPLADWWSGRTPGAGAMATALPRSLIPNAGAYYVGRKPLALPPVLQSILDVGAQRGADRMVPR